MKSTSYFKLIQRNSHLFDSKHSSLLSDIQHQPQDWFSLTLCSLFIKQIPFTRRTHIDTQSTVKFILLPMFSRKYAAVNKTLENTREPKQKNTQCLFLAYRWRLMPFFTSASAFSHQLMLQWDAIDGVCFLSPLRQGHCLSCRFLIMIAESRHKMGVPVNVRISLQRLVPRPTDQGHTGQSVPTSSIWFWIFLKQMS